MPELPETPEFRKVAVAGAGAMGAGLAQICAAAGSQVCLYDVGQEILDSALARIQSFLELSVGKGKTTEEDRQRTLDGIKPTLDLHFATKDADLVIEAVPEILDLKNGLFKEVASHCGPDAILASNTSSLSLAKVFEGVEGHGRCIGMHFFNPPPLMPLLEVVHMDSSTPATVERVLQYGKQLGKEPIIVKDSPGFASSRLGIVLGLEAIRMVESGVAEPADIDKAMELGYRHPMGPLRLTDLVGLDVRLAIADYLCQELKSPAFEAPKLLRDMVSRGDLGKKTGQGFYEWQD